MRWLIWLVFPMIFSCKSKDDVPEGILKPEKMQEIFWDFTRADVYTTQFIRKDTSKNTIAENLRLQKKIFALHKTSKAEFYKSYTYYSNHKELMTRILDTILTRQKKELLKLKPD
jgi:Domain of unknown function (DUF4296)